MSENNEKPIYAWSSFPLMDFPKKSIVLIVFLFLIFYFLYYMTIQIWNQPLYYVVGVLMLFIGIIPYFVLTRYEIYDYHFIVKYPFFTIKKRYDEYGCFYADKNGIMLGTFKQPRRLDVFRGQSFRFSGTQEERKDVLEFLETRLKRV